MQTRGQPGRASWRRALARLLLAALVVSIASAAQAAGGVVFLDSRTLTLRLSVNAAPQTVNITVLNTGSTTQAVTLTVNSLSDALGAAFPGRMTQIEPSLAGLGPGKTHDFVLIYTRGEGDSPLSPSYSGQLVVTGSDGSLDRRALVLLAAAAPPASAAAERPVFDPAFVQTLSLPGVNNWPSIPPTWFDGVNDISVAIAQRYAKTDQTQVGSLSSDTGALAQVVVNRSQVVIQDVKTAGTYKGKLDFQPGTEAGKVDVTLTVRDAWWWAVVVLFLGLLLTFFLQWMISATLPRKRLKLRITQLQVRTESEQMEAGNKAKAQIPAGVGLKQDVITIYDAAHGGLLTIAGQALLDGFDGKQVMDDTATAGSRAAHRWDWLLDRLSPPSSPEDRKRWGPDGPEYKTVEEHLTTVTEMHKLTFALVETYLAVQARDGDIRAPDDLKDYDLSSAATPALQEAVKALEPVLITTVKELAERQSALKSAAVFLKAFRETAIEILALYTETRELKPEHAQAIELLDQLYSKRVTDADTLSLLQADARRLRLKLDAHPKLFRITPIRGPEAGAPSPAESWFVADNALIALIHRLVVPKGKGPETLDSLQHELRWANLKFKAVSLVIVLLTGLYTFYLPNATFGSAKDYLALLLWGSTLSGGLELIRRYFPDLASNSGG